jgi:Ca-activated chloride channel family protein
MDALDFSDRGQQVSRMQVVKGVMGRFIDEREGDRIGLIIFGTEAFVLAPLTVDRHAVHQLLAGVVPSIAGGSTALGDAIALGVKKLRVRPEGSRVMILIADGDNTAGSFQPLEAAALARMAGIRIYVIGVGSKREQIPILHEGKIEYWDDLTMDEATLQQIAEITGGGYFRATNTRALQEISQRIGELEKTESETRTVFLPEPLYRWPLAVALLALLALGLFPEGRFRSLRRRTSA